MLFEFGGAVSMNRVFGAINFTAITIGRASSVAPDITKARVSASRILTLIRRKPTIDSYSKDGLKLVRTALQSCMYIFVNQLVPAHAHVHVVFKINILRLWRRQLRYFPHTCFYFED